MYESVSVGLDIVILLFRDFFFFSGSAAFSVSMHESESSHASMRRHPEAFSLVNTPAIFLLCAS